jgi:2-polyprenyl-6-methoxyphenol hydroxylase-like FAD-dependent oxidoreductase
MVLKLMLDKFNIDSLIMERQNEMQQHPKAHYLSFRTCEILSDLGLGKNLSAQLKSLSRWNSYTYTTHVLADPIAVVRHFDSADLAEF